LRIHRASIMSANFTVEDLIPWSWVLTPLDPSQTSCPSPNSILGTYAAVNGIMALLTLLCSNVKIVRKFTCNAFGDTGDPPVSWTYMWIVSVALQLGANAIIARLIMGAAADYKATFNVADMLQLHSRPNLTPRVFDTVHVATKRIPTAAPFFL